MEQEQQRVLREIDQWCAEYEQTIRDLGGIGFFTKSILYFLHERGWSKVKWLKTNPPLLQEHEI